MQQQAAMLSSHMTMCFCFFESGQRFMQNNLDAKQL